MLSAKLIGFHGSHPQETENLIYYESLLSDYYINNHINPSEEDYKFHTEWYNQIIKRPTLKSIKAFIEYAKSIINQYYDFFE
jgi:hypothetical protein